MKRWPRSRNSWRRRSAGRRWPAIARASLLQRTVISFCLAAAAFGAVARADRPPRYALRRVYGERPGPRAVILTLGEVTWAQLRQADMPALHRLIDEGEIGLMPVAAPSDSDPTRTWVTLGAGRSSVGQASAGRVLEAGPQGLRIDMAGVVAANADAATSSRPGLLGALLRGSGLTTAAVIVGGKALPPASPSLLVLADSDGRLDGGVAAMPDDPGVVAEAVARWDVTLVDLTKVVAPRSRAPARSPFELDEARAAALHAADKLVGAVLTAVQGQDVLIAIVAPTCPAYGSLATRNMGPLVLWESARATGPALLTSASTRWEGVVTAADLAPTLLDWWGIEGRGTDGRMAGREMRAVPRSDAPTRLDALDRMLVARQRLFVSAAWLYPVYGFLVICAFMAVSLWRPARLSRLAIPTLTITTVSVGLLLAPLFGGHRSAPQVAAAAAVALVLAAAGGRARRPALGLALVMLAGAAIIGADVVLGSRLMRRSALGFGAMLGSRFYGLGNEYAGFLIGMAVVGIGALLDVAPRWRSAAVIGGAAVVLVIGAPFWGANWGGSLAAACGVAAVCLLSKEKLGWKSVVGAVVIVAVSGLLPPALDLLRPAAERTHIGAAAEAVLSGRAGLVADIVARKVAMSFGIIRYAPATLALPFVVAAALWVALRPGAPARQALERRPALQAGAVGALFAGVVAIFVNDSGIVAAVGPLIVAVSGVLFLGARGAEGAA